MTKVSTNLPRSVIEWGIANSIESEYDSKLNNPLRSIINSNYGGISNA
jgi:hypothetical protein